ncbi:MAG: hypothetical protein ACOC00_00155 [Halothiobacillaceae bacterium]
MRNPVASLFGTSRLWTPADLAPAAWFDTDADLTTINDATANDVDEWTDQVNGHRIESYSSSRPVIGTLNGKTVVQCGVGQFLDEDLASVLAITNAAVELWLFCVIRVDAIDAANRYPLGFSTGSSTVSFRATLSVDDSGAGNVLQAGGRIRDDDSYGAAVGSTDLSVAASHIIGGRFRPDANTIAAWVDGVEEQEDTTWTGSAAASFDASDSLDISVGDDNLSLGDLIIVRGTLSDLNRQRIEGYLAHEFGLTARLDASHPYKTDAPTI